jgi:hypothetical protein
MVRFCVTCRTPLEAEDLHFCNKCGATVAAPPDFSSALPAQIVSDPGRSITKKVVVAAVLLLSVAVFATWEHMKPIGANGTYELGPEYQFGDVVKGVHYFNRTDMLELTVKQRQVTGWANISEMWASPNARTFGPGGIDLTFAGPLTKDACNQNLLPNPDGCARVNVTSHWGRCSSEPSGECTRDEGTTDITWKAGHLFFGGRAAAKINNDTPAFGGAISETSE